MQARLLIACPDRHGIVAAVSGFLAARDANIVTSDQYSTDPEGGAFFMRMAFTIDALGEDFARAFASEVAERFAMQWRLDDAGRAKRVAVLVSREDHCLLDLLWRRRRGELHCEIPLVISNHPDHAADVEGFGVRYEHVPVVKGEKPAAEARMLELLSDQEPRPRRPRPLHADPQRRLPRRRRLPGDQHPPLVPAGLRGGRPVPPRAWSAA